MKNLIVRTVGQFVRWLSLKIVNLRALAIKLKINHGKDFYLINPGFIQFQSEFVVGDRVYINSNFNALIHSPVRIESDVIIAPNVSFFTVGHDPDLSGAACRESRVLGEIHVGSGVWIGGGSILLPGVTIGENSVIGAGSVVTRSIPPNVIAAGNPCRVIREKAGPKP